MAVHILGIRHHGVGSARYVAEQLASLQPDIVLVEGPPEIQEVFPHVGKPALKPPVAIMLYDSKEPKNATFYPFADYSPEWVAINYANEHGIPVRALDLPTSIAFTQRKKKQKEAEETHELADKQEPVPVFKDPMLMIAETAGFDTGEQFWEHHFEQNTTHANEHFDGVMHLMTALRSEGLKSNIDEENVAREAYMRSIISQVQNEMYESIAVICGAWHGPALVDIEGQAKTDQRILNKLPKPKVQITTTWIPWTNGRLSMNSGYGAGILSPGWYEHLWTRDEQRDIKWLTKVAELFREEGIDISTAHVIETYRLANSLALLRGKHYLSLDEMNEAIIAVMCMGDVIMLELVREHLIVGERLGEVPEDMPKMPLQEDFEQCSKKLRLKLSAAPKTYNLDLRKEIDRTRSVFFHRLEILDFPWVERRASRSKGTFKESWKLQWSPEMMINLIDKAYLGNTIELAAQQIVLNQVQDTYQVSKVAELIVVCIPSNLYEELDILLQKINELSSISSDVLDLIKAVPQLIDISRYGDVRQTDLSIMDAIIDQLLIKINSGLTNACYGLNEENAIDMFEHIGAMNHSVKIYSKQESELHWYKTLFEVLNKEEGIHTVILGCVCRLLLDAQQLTEDESSARIALALSSNNDPVKVASWVEGFLKGSGMILIYDSKLWNLIYEWVTSLPKEVFMELLPLLRRSFSKFEYGERRQIGEKAKKGLVPENAIQETGEEYFDEVLADSILPTIVKFLKPAKS